MSATGRGAERIPAEYYPTPEWCVHRLVERLQAQYGSTFFDFNGAVEPAVGDGAICRAWSTATGTRLHWCCNDIRDVRSTLDLGGGELARLDQGDAVRWLATRGGWSGRWLCITNPPFSLALPILDAAVGRFAVVAFLLRVGILGAADGRHVWFQQHRASLYVLPDRPSFYGDGTDSATYAWFVWGPEPKPVDVLDPTPRAIRKAAEDHARARVAALRGELAEHPPATPLFGGSHANPT